MSLEDHINKINPVAFPMGKEYYITTFTDLLINSAPEYEKFGTHSLFRSLKPEREEIPRFNKLEPMIFKKLLDNGIVEPLTYSHQLMLSDFGIEVKKAGGLSNYIKIMTLEDKTNKGKSIVTHNYNGVGQINQDSTFVNSTNNINSEPTEKSKKSILSKIWEFTSHPIVVFMITSLIAFLIAYFFNYKSPS